MAFMIPDTIPRKATSGERMLFDVLKKYLPEDYVVYYEPMFNNFCPDFVIIGPDLGLVILEVKDYTLNTLFELYPDKWRIYCSSGTLETVKNPINQARDNAFNIVNILKKDKSLIQLEGKYFGYLKFPYGYGTVFTRLKQTHIVKHQLQRVIPVNLMLTREDIDPDDPSFSEEIFVEKIIGLITIYQKNKTYLSQDDINTIRYHLFPEVRIHASNEQIMYQDQLLLSLHNIKAMDLHQEILSKQIGDRHRLIRGVAGSGKTLILACRAKQLVKLNPEWKVLVLCYAIPLSRTLKNIITQKLNEPEDLFDFSDSGSISFTQSNNYNIEVYTFHEWLKKVLKTTDDNISFIIEKLINNEAIFPTYDAILIDEGQDFEPEWLKLLSLVLNPKTQSLLIVEDKAQSIFNRKISYAQGIGLDFRGRSKILNINYRNTAQIAQFAWNFYSNNSGLKDIIKEGTIEGVEIIPPQLTKRKGPHPIIQRFQSFNDEVTYIVQQINCLSKDKNLKYSDFAILYRVKNDHKQAYAEKIISALKLANIPTFWITENSHSKRQYDSTLNNVKVTTIDSSKGLDFQVVFIVNIENLPFNLQDNLDREVALFYIGMTRALEYLYLTYSGDSLFTKYLDNIEYSPVPSSFTEVN